jgi:hypothetical protein
VSIVSSAICVTRIRFSIVSTQLTSGLQVLDALVALVYGPAPRFVSFLQPFFLIFFAYDVVFLLWPCSGLHSFICFLFLCSNPPSGSRLSVGFWESGSSLSAYPLHFLTECPRTTVSFRQIAYMHLVPYPTQRELDQSYQTPSTLLHAFF